MRGLALWRMIIFQFEFIISIMPNQTYTQKLQEEKFKELKKQFSIDNIFDLPRLMKIVVNIGLGENRFDENKIIEIKNNLALISGQNPVEIKAKKSIASFKLRIGQINALKVTLRGKKMYAFLDKLLNIVLPRQRDFRGLRKTTLDKNGILHIGILDYSVFPEISPENLKTNTGLSADIITNSDNVKLNRDFFKMIGVVFETEEARKMREETVQKARIEAKIREEKAKEYRKLAQEEAAAPEEEQKETNS